LEISPSPAPAKFLAGFAECQCSAAAGRKDVQLITDKTNAVDLSSGVVAIKVSVTGTQTKTQN